jgi:hypothetical protein
MTRRTASTFVNPLVSVVMPVYNEQDIWTLKFRFTE